MFSKLHFYYLLLIAGLGFMTCRDVQAVVPPDYEATIQSAHAGRASDAAEKLKAWLDADPSNPRILYDLVTVLHMAGQDEAAMRYYDRVVRDDAPLYALKAVGASARHVGKPDLAAKAYELALTKAPQDQEVHAGMAYVLVAEKRTGEAYDYVVSRLPRLSSSYVHDDIPLIVALGELHEQREEWLSAAEAFQDVLKLEPGFRYAERERIFALNKAGMAHLANRMAERKPELFSSEERHRLAQDAEAHAIFFGEANRDAGQGPSRFGAADIALANGRDVDARFGEKPVSQFDRLVALRDRMRMQETVDLYQSLVQKKLDIPPYAKVAAADAYLYLEQPEVARDLYQEALKEVGDDERKRSTYEWQTALMYAYVEAEQHDEAQALADKLSASTPHMVNGGFPEVEVPNEEYAEATVMTARTRLYASRLAQAEKQLQELRAHAPFNSGVRETWGELQFLRDHPRASLDEFTALHVDEPTLVDASIKRGEVLLALDRFAESKEVLKPLLMDYPESKPVQDFARKVAYYDAPTLQIETTIGSGGSSQTKADSVTDAKLYSAPLTNSLGDPFRIFTHASHSHGEAQDGGAISRTQVGAGVNYRANDMTVEGEVHHTLDSPAGNGMALSMSLTLSDAWHVNASADTNVNDLPAEVYLAGVTAKTASVGVTWVDNESRNISGNLSRSFFSDGNARDVASLEWYERWYSGPRWRFDTTTMYAASRNSGLDRAYFNPARDDELDVTFGAEWLTWRRYRRSFSQRLSYTAGRYWQDGFGPAAVSDIRYEHIWSDENHVDLRYGIGYSYHPYDEIREGRRYGFVSLNWQLK
jgi:biofilm PGA synthesis protein PgaA